MSTSSSSSSVPNATAAASAAAGGIPNSSNEERELVQELKLKNNNNNNKEPGGGGGGGEPVKTEAEEEEEEEKKEPISLFPAVLEPTGRSQLELYGEAMRARETYVSLVSRTWPTWRRTVSRFVRFNPWFERIVFVLIVINALVIVLDSVVEGASAQTVRFSKLSIAVDVLDNFVTWAFVVEMLFKFVALGLWTNGSGYFGSFGNWVDFLINVFSVYATIQELVSSVGLGNAASAVRSVRLLRTFRAVKALRHLRLLVDALFVALKRLADVGVLYLIFITFMCFIGLQLFRHRYGRNCVFPIANSSSVLGPNGTISSNVVHQSFDMTANRTIYWQSNQQICEYGMPVDVAEHVATLPLDTNYSYTEPFSSVDKLFQGYVCPYGSFCMSGLPNPERGLISFDSIFFAFTSLVTVSVFENWDVIMYDAMYARGLAASWYFLVVAMIGSIFVLNLVLAILTDAFTQSLTVLRATLEGEDVTKEFRENALKNEIEIHSRPNFHLSAEEGGGKSAEEISAEYDEYRDGGMRGTIDEEIEMGAMARSRAHTAFQGAAAGGSGNTTKRRTRSYTVVSELRGRVDNTKFALNSGSSPAASSRNFTEEQIDDSLDWLHQEWALVVLEARKEEDMATFAATTLNEQEFSAGTAYPWLKSKFMRLQSWILQNVVATKWFSGLGFVLTVVNIIILSIVYPKMEPGVRATLNIITIVLAVCFIVESIVRLVGLGWKTFSRDPFNVIDGVLAICSVFEMFLSGSAAISAARTIRLMRLLSYFPSVILALRTLAAAVKAGASLMVQLFIMIFVMAVLGQQLFRAKLCGLDEEPAFLVTETDLCHGHGEVAPAFNFDNLASSVVTVFVVVAGDGWRQYWTDCASRTSPYHSLYFISIYVMGNYLFVNLFVAVLIDAANTSRAASEEKVEITDVPGNEKTLSTIAEGEKGEQEKSLLESNNDNDNNNSNSNSGTMGGNSQKNSKESSSSSSSSSSSATSAASSSSSPNNHNDNNNNNEGSSSTGDCSIKTSKSLQKHKEQRDEERRVLEEELDKEWWNIARKFHKKYVSHSVRVKCAFIANHKIMKTIVAISSFTASISYLFWASATTYPDHWTAAVLDWIEVGAAIISTTDSVLRWVALGRTCSVLIQVINFFSYLTVIFMFVPVPGRVYVIAIFRIITRAIRPWTYAMRFARFRLVFFSLLRAVRALRSVGAIALLIWFTYGVLGAQLFSGKLYACTKGRLEADWGDQTYLGMKLKNETACLANNFTWMAYKYNYDNVGRGMLCLVTAATTDDWSNTMYLTTGVTDEGVAPHTGRTLTYSIFMCSFVVTMAFFLINVIVSVLVDAYFTTKRQMEDDAQSLSDAKERDRQLAELSAVDEDPSHQAEINLGCAGDLDVLTGQQQDYFDLALHALLLVKPTLPVSFGPDHWRWKVRSIIRSRYFNYVYLAITLCDFLIQATTFAHHPPISTWALLHFDTVFSLILIVMTMMRIVGNSFWGFLQSSSNIVELLINFTILTSNIIATAIFSVSVRDNLRESKTDDDVDRSISDEFNHFYSTATAGMILGILRNLRMLRFERVLQTFHGVRVIVFTLRSSARNFVGGLAIVFLIYFFYSALGLALFGRVVYNGSGLTPNNNFQSIPLGMTTLFRVGTLDDWEAVMRACSIQVYPCDYHLGNCGSPFLAVPFFYSFILFGQWIGMSSFVAILLDSFSKADRRERFAVQKRDVDRFRKLWKMFSDGRTQLLSVAKLPLLLQRLGPALSIEEDDKTLNPNRYKKKKSENSDADESSPPMSPMGSPLSLPGDSEPGSPSSPVDASALLAASPSFIADSSVQLERLPGFSAVAGRNNNKKDFNKDHHEHGDFDDIGAGNDFDTSALLAKFSDTDPRYNSLNSRFCTNRRAQQYARDLRLHARDASQFHGVVTQMQVFEACLNHHYGVPLPEIYGNDLRAAFEKTFPLDLSRLASAVKARGGSLANPASARGEKGGEKGEGKISFDETSTEDLLQLIRLQAWWRGQRFRRVVMQAVAERKKALSEAGISVEAMPSASSIMGAAISETDEKQKQQQQQQQQQQNLKSPSPSSPSLGKSPKSDPFAPPKRSTPPTSSAASTSRLEDETEKHKEKEQEGSNNTEKQIEGEEEEVEKKVTKKEKRERKKKKSQEEVDEEEREKQL